MLALTVIVAAYGRVIVFASKVNVQVVPAGQFTGEPKSPMPCVLTFGNAKSEQVVVIP